uniref:Uncharacterized protein n=1 Tax=Anguilla anguilla TaxID=7936 RepID=A0A0E9U626_ANGAN
MSLFVSHLYFTSHCCQDFSHSLYSLRAGL